MVRERSVAGERGRTRWASEVEEMAAGKKLSGSRPREEKQGRRKKEKERKEKEKKKKKEKEKKEKEKENSICVFFVIFLEFFFVLFVFFKRKDFFN